MEYERALYRVYERCLEGLREDDQSDIGSKTCRFCSIISFSASIFFILALTALHLSFVGHGGCLPMILQEHENIRNKSGQFFLQEDQILEINIKNSILPFGYDDSGADSINAINSEPSRRKLRNYLSQSSSYSNVNVEKYLSHSNVTNSLPQILPVSKVSNKSDIYDFVFALDYAVLALSPLIRREHKFEVINITLSNKHSCFGSKAMQSLLPLGGIDTIVINSLMFTFRKPGVLRSASGDLYTWSNDDIKPYDSFTGWVNFKSSIVIVSFFAFMFLSTTTALIVRVMISSGVVLLFPFFWFLQSLGMQPLNIRIISLSYPWLGVPIEMLIAANQPTTPFIVAHLVRVVVLYLMYESVQVAFAMWFYGQRGPGQKELWLYAIMMLWEYYSMVYVRSISSIRMFPRVSLALFMIYHFYLYSFPSGFHIFALLVLFSCLSWLMIYCVSEFERKAYFRGEVSIEQPRALYNSLPWPAWNVALAPEYTLFLPVTQRAVSVYEEAVAARPGMADGGEMAPMQEAGDAAGSGPGDAGSGGIRHRMASLSNAVGAAAAAVASIPRGYSPLHRNHHPEGTAPIEPLSSASGAPMSSSSSVRESIAGLPSSGASNLASGRTAAADGVGSRGVELGGTMRQSSSTVSNV